MDSETWAALKPRDRDALIAEQVMGWEKLPAPKYRLPDESVVELFVGDFYFHADNGSRFMYWPWPMHFYPNQLVPEFSTQVAAAHEVEDEIERRELKCSYVTELLIILGHYTMRGDFNEYWDLVRATPEQRCLAALRAVA